MHWFNIATLFFVLTLAGVEFSVSAFVNPAAWRLEAEAQQQMLSRLASVLGKVMPFWYVVCAVLLAAQTCFRWHLHDRACLIAADTVLLLTIVATILFLVPLNTRVAEGAADWRQIHRSWDRRHRVRIAALAIVSVLLAYVLV